MTALKALCAVMSESTPEQVKGLQERVARLELELAECWEVAERRTRMWHQTLLAYREVKDLLRSLLRNPEKFERLKGKDVEFVIRPVEPQGGIERGQICPRSIPPGVHVSSHSEIH